MQYFISGVHVRRWVGKCVRYYEGRAGWVLAQNTLLQEAQCQCDRKSWSCLVKNPGQTAQKSPKSGTGIVLKGSLPAGSSCLVDMNNNNNNNPIRNIPSHFNFQFCTPIPYQKLDKIRLNMSNSFSSETQNVVAERTYWLE